MELIDPWKGTTQAANTLAALGQQIQQEKKNDQASQLAALQMQQLQSANAEKEATDTALIDTYGTGDRGDRTTQLAAAKSFQAQKSQMDSDLKSDQATVKEIYDLVGKMKDKGIGPDAITPLVQGYASQIKSPQLRQIYSNLQLTNGWGAKTKVAINGTEGYTHPITGQPLAPGEYEMEFDQNQKPTKVNLIKQGAPANAPKSLAELNSNLDYVLREPNATDAQVRLGELAAETGVGGKDLDSVRDMVSKQYTDKADKTQVVEIPAPDGKTAQKYLLNTVTGEKKPVGPAYAVKAQVPNINVHTGNGTTGTDKQIQVWADKIAAGQVTLSDIPARGNIRTQVLADIAERYPNADLNKLKQSIKFDQSTSTMNSKALLNTITPLLDKLQSAGKDLGNSTVPGVNRVTNWVKEQTGDPKIVGFNNLRDDTIAEVERGLMGSGVLSDSKYQRALKNLNSAQSYPQLRAAVANIKTVINARLESLANGPNGGTAQQKTAPAQPQRPKTASDYLSKFK